MSAKNGENFDITDGKNKYEPCPKCGTEYDMAISSRGGIHVVCGECGHKGKSFEYDPHNRTAADKLAFDAWNAESRCAQSQTDA